MTGGAWTELRLAPPGSAQERGWAHSGIVTLGPDLLTIDPLRSVVVRLTAAGEIVDGPTLDVVQAHGMSLAADEASLWVADCAAVNVEVAPGRYIETRASEPARGAVVHVDLAGRELARFTAPDIRAYEGKDFQPTSVVVDEPALGGTGDVWVADGYGQNHVHRIDPTHGFVGSLELPGPVGGWDTPHGLHIDRRSGDARLLVADRGNRRICSFDLDGCFVGELTHDAIRRPTAVETSADLMFVADLSGSVAVFDATGVFVTSLGSAATRSEHRPGWPNRIDERGREVPPAFVDGRLNSPHDLTVTDSGRIAVCEWVLGGRVCVLDPPV